MLCGLFFAGFRTQRIAKIQVTEFHETHQIRTLCPDPDTLKFGANAPRIDGCRLCNTSVFLLKRLKHAVHRTKLDEICLFVH